jgi:hypothetical protein
MVCFAGGETDKLTTKGIFSGLREWSLNRSKLCLRDQKLIFCGVNKEDP